MTEDNYLEFFNEALRLKRMPRSGWIYSGVPLSKVESVADHTYMVSLISLMTALEEKQKGYEVDVEKVLIMSLIHDLSEGISQDIDRRVRKFAPEKFDDFKHDMDKKALEKFADMLPKNTGEKIKEYFYEYLEGKSREAQIVHEADRIEVIFQLVDYVKKGNSKDNFSEFYQGLSDEVDNYQVELINKIGKKLIKED